MQNFNFSTNPNSAFNYESSLASNPLEDTARIFNTTLIASKAPNFSEQRSDILDIMKSSSFNAILVAVRYLAQSESISEALAAERIIATFRKADQAWSDYVYNEGLAKIRSGSEQY